MCESGFSGIKSTESNNWIKTQIYWRKVTDSANFERSENAANSDPKLFRKADPKLFQHLADAKVKSCSNHFSQSAKNSNRDAPF